MEIKLICRYCDEKWTLLVWSAKEVEAKCPKCDDTNIRIVEESKQNTDIYGYNYKKNKKQNDEEFSDE